MLLHEAYFPKRVIYRADFAALLRNAITITHTPENTGLMLFRAATGVMF